MALISEGNLLKVLQGKRGGNGSRNLRGRSTGMEL